MRIKRGFYILPLVLVTALFWAATASAAVDNVRCILWQGDPAKYHTTMAGHNVRLKAVVTTTNADPVWYRWNFGDGSAPSAVVQLSGATSYNVEIDHVYTGVPGTPFSAQLEVDDVDNSMANAVADNYLVKVEETGLDAKINIAIDNGLWYLYKTQMTNSYTLSFDGSDVTVWYYGYYFASPTASAVHAFGINNHKINGDFSEDPYAEAARKGMNWLTQGYYRYTSRPMLQTLAISAQHGDDPDANGNGVGIEVRDYNYRPIYEGGQIMDAIIASGVQPGDDTGRDFTNRGTNWTFGELLQDMCDMYAYGQHDTVQSFTDYTTGTASSGIIGGWRYSWHQHPDNSACQWAAIGMIPAQQAPWNCVVPDWVKTYNNNWLNYSHIQWNWDGSENIWGGFGYTSASWGDALTPSGMVQLPFVEKDTSDPRWVKSERWFADNWKDVGRDWLDRDNVYGYYAFAKAMRLAQPTPVETFASNGFNWYRGSATTMGLAEKIADRLISNHNWNYYGTSLGTAWCVITLKPEIFKAAPIACFTADPNPAYPDMDITFDPGCSDHSETGKDISNLTLFEWDWNNDGTYDQSTTTPDPVTHAFACDSLPCDYLVTLRVTDDDEEELTATYTLQVDITNPPHPPTADAGGPYMVSRCEGDSLVLDGSGSYDINEGKSEEGCTECEPDTITAWEWDLSGAPWNYDDASGETISVDPSSLPVGTSNIGLRVTDNTENSFPTYPDGNLTDEDFGIVTVYEACGACDLYGVAKLGKIQIIWEHTGAAGYDVYRSTAGPNSGFELIADDHVTDYATYLDRDVVAGTTYHYRVVASDGCGFKALEVTAASSRRGR
jgi:hypothetical protein